jgi:hypothetical protein
MNRREREQLAEDLLERALSQEAVEPPAGLEQRILDHLDSRAHGRAGGLWRGVGGWVAAVVAAAIVVLFGLRSLRRESAPPVQAGIPHPIAVAPAPQQVALAPAPPPDAAGRKAASAPGRPATGAARAARREGRPRQEVFPVPVPLTEQERLLLALVQGQRREAERVAMLQQTERDEFQKYLDTGGAAEAQPMPAQDVR